MASQTNKQRPKDHIAHVQGSFKYDLHRKNCDLKELFSFTELHIFKKQLQELTVIYMTVIRRHKKQVHYIILL